MVQIFSRELLQMKANYIQQRNKESKSHKNVSFALLKNYF